MPGVQLAFVFAFAGQLREEILDHASGIFVAALLRPLAEMVLDGPPRSLAVALKVPDAPRRDAIGRGGHEQVVLFGFPNRGDAFEQPGVRGQADQDATLFLAIVCFCYHDSVSNIPWPPESFSDQG